MENYDVIVVGGGPAALVASTTVRATYPDKKIAVIRRFKKVPIPCGIPYILQSLKGVQDDVMPDMAYEKHNIELIIDEVIDGDAEEKKIILKSGKELTYEKLILATGSEPIVPKFIPGYDKEGVYLVYKNLEYLDRIVKASENAKDIVIVGAGFIGMEFADELVKKGGYNIHIIEMEEHALIRAFDPEFCEVIEQKFKEAGVNFHLGKKLVQIEGDGKVTGVKLESGERIKADLVLFGIGARPNTELAEKMNLKVENKGIWVDEYCRTSHPDVFAVGDCSTKVDFFTRRPTSVMLASTACAEARVAGANLYSLQVVRENKGTIGVFSTNLQGITLATAGLTELQARNLGFQVVTATATSKDRHPGKFPDTSDLKVKLIFSGNCGVLLGGQVMGGKGAGEMINIIGLAIQQRMHVGELFTLQFGTHPLLTSAPTTYPLITAAQMALNKLRLLKK